MPAATLTLRLRRSLDTRMNALDCHLYSLCPLLALFHEVVSRRECMRTPGLVATPFRHSARPRLYFDFLFATLLYMRVLRRDVACRIPPFFRVELDPLQPQGLRACGRCHCSNGSWAERGILEDKKCACVCACVIPNKLQTHASLPYKNLRPAHSQQNAKRRC